VLGGVKLVGEEVDGVEAGSRGEGEGSRGEGYGSRGEGQGSRGEEEGSNGEGSCGASEALEGVGLDAFC